MYIGEASKKSGLSIKAIRFYEEIGLIRRLPRSGRYRVYSESDIDLLVLIKEAKQLGVKLSQLKMVFVYKDGNIDWSKIKIFLAELRMQLLSNIKDCEKKVAMIDECYKQIKF